MASASILDKRKSFEMRMSKKVAELTQVVHMLFMRNHEKEVEIEAVRTAYEEEIAHVIEDAKKKLREKEDSVSKKRDSDKEDVNKLKEKYEVALAGKEKEFDAKIKLLEQKVVDEKKSSQSLRDCLALMQKELESARSSMHKGKLALEQELHENKATIHNLHARIGSLEKAFKELETKHQETLSDHEARSSKHGKETQKLQTLAEHNRRLKEELTQKNTELENEVKNMRREWQRRLSESLRRSQLALRQKDESEGSSEEVDMLRRQLLRYKMELFNRDNNYTKVFGDQHQTLNVDSRAGLIAAATQSISGPSAMSYGGHSEEVVRPTGPLTSRPTKGSGLQSSPGAFQREKTFSYVISQSYEIEQDEPLGRAGTMSSRESRGTNNPIRLPSVHTFSGEEESSTSQMHRLAKPRPPDKRQLVATEGN